MLKQNTKRNFKSPQTDLFVKNSKSYGGTLLKKRKYRAYARPLSTKQPMHLVLKSSLAVGVSSFKHGKNPHKIKEILEKFAVKHGIAIDSLANVGNHLHLQIKITSRHGYYRFIRATTSAIAMFITGRNRWSQKTEPKKFWDYRPFSRILSGLKDIVGVKNYIEINQLEGLGTSRVQARWMLMDKKIRLC